ncbi:MAG TPA: hypothetical protein VIH76_02690, partial [Candidatus Acidoferrales bacterium]
MTSKLAANPSSHLVHRRFSPAAVLLIALTILGCSRAEDTVVAQTPPPPPLTFVAEWGTHGREPGQLGRPEWLTTDFTGNVFIADSGTGSIEKF